MVAPADVGAAAAARLMSGPDDVGVAYVEGPRRYSSSDVAQAFARALGRTIEVEVTPREQWRHALLSFGFL